MNNLKKIVKFTQNSLSNDLKNPFKKINTEIKK